MSSSSRPMFVCALAGRAPSPELLAELDATVPHAVRGELRCTTPARAVESLAESELLLDPHASLGALSPVIAASARLDALARSEAIDDEPALDRLLRDALFRQGRTTDFHTGEEHDKVRFHLFALLSERSHEGRFADVLELVEAIGFHDLPIVVHAILDGVDMPPRSAWPMLEELEARLERRGGVIGTLSGRSWALDRSGRWDRCLSVYEAVVRGDVDVMPSAHAALEAAYRDGFDDAELPPVRIGGYRGLVGDLCAELPGGAWEWRGEEVGLLLGASADGLGQLAAALLRRGVPAEVERLLALRGRPMFAFTSAQLASLVPMAPGLELPSVLGHATSTRGLLRTLADAGPRVAHVIDPRLGAQARVGPWSSDAGEESVAIPPRLPRALSLQGPPPALPMEVVFEAMQAALERGEPPPSPSAPHEGGGSEPEPAPEPFDPGAALASRVAERARDHDLVWVTVEAESAPRVLAELAPASASRGADLVVVDATAPVLVEGRAVAARWWWLGADGRSSPEACDHAELGRALVTLLGGEVAPSEPSSAESSEGAEPAPR